MESGSRDSMISPTVLSQPADDRKRDEDPVAPKANFSEPSRSVSCMDILLAGKYL
jgi:hypothetical protein